MAILANSASRADDPLPAGLAVLGWIGAIGLPVGVGATLRRSNLVPLHGRGRLDGGRDGPRLVPWCRLPISGARCWRPGVIVWGVLDRRAERINLGIAGFALTVLVFYFSDVMDKLGRSASLIVLGLLFLGGGYLLEQARRRLVATVREPAR